MRKVFDGYALPCVLLEIAFDVVFFEIDVSRETVMNNYPLGAMLKALNENREKDPKGVLEGVHASVDAFVGEAPQFDDLTMLCPEYRGTEGIE